MIYADFIKRSGGLQLIVLVLTVYDKRTSIQSNIDIDLYFLILAI